MATRVELCIRWIVGILLLTLYACTGAVPREAAPPEYRIVGYEFAGNGIQISPPAAGMLTHVNYAFANVRSDGRVVLEDSLDSKHLARLVRLKRHNSNLKVLLSIGGWAWSDYFSDAALTEASRESFARSAVSLVDKHNLDGLDIDWEYPGQRGENNVFREVDRENFTRLLAETRDHLRKLRARTGRVQPYLLTIAAGAGANYLANTNIVSAARYLDFINVMTYDFHGAWSSQTGHLANLFTPSDTLPSAASSISRYLRAGVSADKLVLGVPFYGRGWRGVQKVNKGLNQPFGEYAASYPYDLLASTYVDKNGFTLYWDQAAQAPYLWQADSAIFITFENRRSLRRKVAFVRSRELGGIMYWEHSGDTPELTLLSTIHQYLQ